MNQIAKRITGTPTVNAAEMAMRIKQEAPTLADLNNEQLEQIAKLVIAQRLTAELNAKVNTAGIDYRSEKEIFLDNCGKTDSKHTHKSYRAGIDRLEAWIASMGLNILELTASQADDYCYSLRGRAAASIRLDIAAASSFFTWLHRRHNAIENPFKGSRARPAKKAVKKLEIPTAQEVKLIIKELSAYESAAAAVMIHRGLRAGGLSAMSITGGRFTTYSKGKDLSGELPAPALEAIKKAGLPLRGPFNAISTNTLEQRVIRGIRKLYKAGKVSAPFSCHDLRHYFSITQYRTDKDIHKLCKLLGHASIMVTENYLKGLGEAD